MSIYMFKALRADGSCYFFHSTGMERALEFASDAIIVGCCDWID